LKAFTCSVIEGDLTQREAGTAASDTRRGFALLFVAAQWFGLQRDWSEAKMNSEENQLRDEILEQASVSNCPSVFVIGHGASQVTVRAQQIRALNLLWALSRKSKIEGESIVIVGGGIARITAAAAAVLHGARVTLLEQHDEAMHLQRGCNTRYLHPRIFEWPSKNARRAGAELPILNWSVGTASDVATRILADYAESSFTPRRQETSRSTRLQMFAASRSAGMEQQSSGMVRILVHQARLFSPLDLGSSALLSVCRAAHIGGSTH
jgi:hypothetical protein